MRSYSIAVIPGDGAGPGIIKEGQRAIEAAADNFRLEWVSYPYGANHYLKTEETLPDAALGEICSLEALYVGPIGSPRVRVGFIEKCLLGKLRSCLDQHIGVRPVKLYPGVCTPIYGIRPADVDFYLVRENSEDFYVGIGGLFWKTMPGEIAVQAGVISRKGCERVMTYAFGLAKEKKKNLVTSCDKADTMAHSYGLWRRVFLETSAKHKKIRTEFTLVNNLVQSLILNPSHYQIVVAPNMFGDMLSELSALLQGPGMAYGAEVNPKGISTFKPLQRYDADKFSANPLGSVLAGAMMLEHLGEKKAAKRIETAVAELLRQGKQKTPDFGGTSKTEQVGRAIEKLIR